MQFQQNTFGHGSLILDDGDHATITEMADAWQSRTGVTEHTIMADLLEQFGFSTNGKLYPIQPIDVGGLTDAPMFSNDIIYTDEGKVSVLGDVWWYPQYEHKDFIVELLANGQVTFTHAH